MVDNDLRYRSLQNLLVLSLVIIAIAKDCVEKYHHREFTVDQGYQVQAALNLVCGNGLSVNSLPTGTDERMGYAKLSAWPPGYSIALALVLVFFRDLWWSTLIVDWCGVVLFFFTWYFILNKLPDIVDIVTKVFIWCYWAFIFSPLSYGLPSQILAYSFFSMSLLFSLMAVNSISENLTYSILAGVGMAFACLMHYAYWPLVVVSPAIIFMSHLTLPNKKLRLLGGYLSIPISIMFVIMVYNITGAGQFYPELSKQGRELYWENLMRVTYFPTLGLGIAHGLWRIWGLLGIPGSYMEGARWIVTIIVLLWFFFGLYRLVRLERAGSKFRGNHFSNQIVFLVVGSVATFATVVSLLVYMSLKTPATYFTPQGWSYVQETRYYAPIFGFLLVILASVLTVSVSGLKLMERASVISCRLFFCVVVCSVGYRNLQHLWGHLNQGFGKAGFSGEKEAIVDAVEEVSREGRVPVYIGKDDLETIYPNQGVAIMAGAINCSAMNSYEWLRTVENKAVIFVTNREAALSLVGNFSKTPVIQQRYTSAGLSIFLIKD